jgi:hypothetical protein
VLLVVLAVRPLGLALRLPVSVRLSLAEPLRLAAPVTGTVTVTVGVSLAVQMPVPPGRDCQPECQCHWHHLIISSLDKVQINDTR